MIPYRHTFHAKKDVLPACEMALASLQLEYLDLYLIHGPVSFKEGAVGTEDKDNLGYDPNRIARTWEVGRPTCGAPLRGYLEIRTHLH